MNTQTKHAESGCTDYLQHTWESCPENKPNKAQNPAKFGAKQEHSPLPEKIWNVTNARGATIHVYAPSSIHAIEIANSVGFGIISDVIEEGKLNYELLEAERNRLQWLLMESEAHANKLAEALRDIAARANFMLVRDPQNLQADYLLQQANNALRAYEAAQ